MDHLDEKLSSCDSIETPAVGVGIVAQGCVSVCGGERPPGRLAVASLRCRRSTPLRPSGERLRPSLWRRLFSNDVAAPPAFRFQLERILPLAIIAIGLLTLVADWAPFSHQPLDFALVDLRIGLMLISISVTLVHLTSQPRRVWVAFSLLGAGVLLALVVLVQGRLLIRYTNLVPIAGLLLLMTQGGVTLEQRNREVCRLNEELRRQIQDRSARLSAALARVGQLSETKMKERTFAALIGDHYKIIRRLGQGGMGVVYEVECVTEGRRFALKTLLRADSGAWLARLAREAQAATAAMHSNIVHVVDIDVDDTGMPFIVMELVDGGALSEQQQRFGDTTFARTVMRQVAAGLSALHEAGVVHRDLKPANVLLQKQPGGAFCAKIVDFGIARVRSERRSPLPTSLKGMPNTSDFVSRARERTEETQAADDVLTRTGSLLGTPLYMAPELASGVKDALPSCDLWSLGVLGYQIACGRLPFVEPPIDWAGDGARQRTVIDMQLLPEPLKGVIERCLDIDPANRPTALEVATRLA